MQWREQVGRNLYDVQEDTTVTVGILQLDECSHGTDFQRKNKMKITIIDYLIIAVVCSLRPLMGYLFKYNELRKKNWDKMVSYFGCSDCTIKDNIWQTISIDDKYYEDCIIISANKEGVYFGIRRLYKYKMSDIFIPFNIISGKVKKDSPDEVTLLIHSVSEIKIEIDIFAADFIEGKSEGKWKYIR